MKRWICALLALALAAGCLAGCKNGDKEASAPEGSSSTQEEGGRLTVYSPLPQEILDLAADGFHTATGVELTIVRNSADQLLKDIRSERNVDVLFGAGAEVVYQNRGLFVPYATAEKAGLDQQFLRPDDLYTPLTPMPIVLMYNKNQTTRAPAGWNAILNSAYAGWVAFADPAKSGTSYTALALIDQLSGKEESKPLPEAAVETLHRNLNNKMLPGISDVYAGVASGTFAAGVTLENSAQKYLDAGYDGVVGISYPSEGTVCALEVSALVKDAPHEAEAKQFIDYVSSKEFQEILVKQFQLRTARGDLDDPEGLTPRKEIVFAPYDLAAAVEGREALLKRFPGNEDRAAEPTE